MRMFTNSRTKKIAMKIAPTTHPDRVVTQKTLVWPRSAYHR